MESALSLANKAMPSAVSAFWRNGNMNNEKKAARKLLYTTEDVCSLCGVCDKTIYRAVKLGSLKRQSGFGRLRFTPSSVAKYMGVTVDSLQSGGVNE